MTKIRVLIADDHAVLRAGLKMLINDQHDLEVVGEAGRFTDVIRLAPITKPDVITLDLTMPDGRAVERIEQICRECPAAKILVLTMHDDPAYLRAALSAGASGYVVKKAADTELLGAIRAVHAGRTFVSGGSHSMLLTPAVPTSNGSALPNEPLSKRERTVLERLAQGYTNQAIADELDLSVKTVESYRARMLRKLGLSSRADIVRYAIEAGILTRHDAKESL